MAFLAQTVERNGQNAAGASRRWASAVSVLAGFTIHIWGQSRIIIWVVPMKPRTFKKPKRSGLAEKIPPALSALPPGSPVVHLPQRVATVRTPKSQKRKSPETPPRLSSAVYSAMFGRGTLSARPLSNTAKSKELSVLRFGCRSVARAHRAHRTCPLCSEPQTELTEPLASVQSSRSGS